MARVAFKMQLIKGFEEEYQKRHDALPSDLKQLLKETGIRDYGIFLDESNGALFALMEVADETKLASLPQHPVMQKWWKFMGDIMQTNSDSSPVSTPLKEVFYLP